MLHKFAFLHLAKKLDWDVVSYFLPNGEISAL